MFVLLEKTTYGEKIIGYISEKNSQGDITTAYFFLKRGLYFRDRSLRLEEPRKDYSESDCLTFYSSDKIVYSLRRVEEIV